jgi:hypothetical protein
MTTTKDSCSGIKQFIVGSSGATQQRPSLNENYGFLLVNVNEDVVTVTKYELLDSDKNNPNGMFLEIKINI